MKPIPERTDTYVAIWAKAVDTQMHFNEMSVKSRQFGLAFVAAALGLSIVLLSKGDEFAVRVPFFGGFDLHATVLIILSGAFALVAVRVLDLNVYHKMLRGAVTFNEDFEEKYMKSIFDLEKGMTQAISHFSRYQDAKVEMKDGKYHYSGDVKKNALEKIRLFYNFSVGSLVAAAVVIFLITAHFGAQPASAAASLETQTTAPKTAPPLESHPKIPPSQKKTGQQGD